MKALKYSLASILLLLGTNAGALPVLTLASSTSSVSQGNQLAVDAIVSGLDDEYIGAFDLTIEWDSTAFSLVDMAFGSMLGGPLDSLQGFTTGAGTLSAFEVAFGDLAAQAGSTSFRLFSMNLLALGSGVQQVLFSASAPQILGDDLGLDYALTSLNGLTVAISPGTTPVSEPASLLLALLGFAGLPAVRRTARA